MFCLLQNNEAIKFHSYHFFFLGMPQRKFIYLQMAILPSFLASKHKIAASPSCNQCSKQYLKLQKDIATD
jgi:hypothetical protein